MEDTGVGVKGLIGFDGTFLVLKKPNRLIDLSGGRQRRDETRKECLLREITEETNLIVSIDKLAAVWSFVKKNRVITGYTYFCSYLDGEITLSDEHVDFFWIDINKINKLKFVPSYGLNQISMNEIAGWQGNTQLWTCPRLTKNERRW